MRSNKMAIAPEPLEILACPFAPWQARACIIENNFDCRPCRQRRCVHEDFRCLRNIAPEEADEVCLQFV
jgi:hypothetical protein